MLKGFPFLFIYLFLLTGGNAKVITPPEPGVTVTISNPTIEIHSIGGDVKFTCEATSPFIDGPLRVTWEKKNGDLPFRRHVIDWDTGTLTISQVQVSDSGTYICLTSDDNIPGQAAATLTVGYRPIMGYEYIQDADAWLRLHAVPATWAAARLRCHLEGGVLASPITDALCLGMTEMMTSPIPSIPRVFTGVQALASKGDFVSLEGVPLVNISLRWAENEPDNAQGSEDCLVLTTQGALADESCSSRRPYICRKEPAHMTVTKCGTTDTGYEWEPRTGSCYKFHRIGRTWHRAQMECHAEGGHLAIINSLNESQALRDIFKNYPEGTMVTNDHIYAGVVLVGFWKWDDKDGDWLTLSGATLAEAGFEKWDDGQPNNVGSDQYCGAVMRNGLLNDVPCHKKRVPFICEITP